MILLFHVVSAGEEEKMTFKNIIGNIIEYIEIIIVGVVAGFIAALII